MKAYYFLGVLVSPLAILSLNICSRVFGTSRTRIILTNEHGEVLLLQTWLSGSKWGFPGGGMKRGESSSVAASRELYEETGIVVSKEDMVLKVAFTASGHQEIVFYAVTSSSLPVQLPNRFEVKAARWFSLDVLPLLEPLAIQVLARVAKSG